MNGTRRLRKASIYSWTIFNKFTHNPIKCTSSQTWKHSLISKFESLIGDIHLNNWKIIKYTPHMTWPFNRCRTQITHPQGAMNLLTIQSHSNDSEHQILCHCGFQIIAHAAQSNYLKFNQINTIQLTRPIHQTNRQIHSRWCSINFIQKLIKRSQFQLTRPLTELKTLNHSFDMFIELT
jgi:hypothetical protein